MRTVDKATQGRVVDLTREITLRRLAEWLEKELPAGEVFILVTSPSGAVGNVGAKSRTSFLREAVAASERQDG